MPKPPKASPKLTVGYGGFRDRRLPIDDVYCGDDEDFLLENRIPNSEPQFFDRQSALGNSNPAY